MNIQEMHNTFRTIGQQMGMQNIRAILPESIDVFINEAIINKVREQIEIDIKTTSTNNINTIGSSMSSMGLLRNLYKVARCPIDINDSTKVKYYNSNNGYYDVSIPIETNLFKVKPLAILAYSIEYKDSDKGNPIGCRIINPDALEDTLHDYCNKASKEYPIISSIGDSNLEFNDSIKLGIYTDTKNCEVKYLNIKYVEYPNIVKFDKDLINCINCNLPEYVHHEIIERAVQRFYNAINVVRPNQDRD